MRVALFGLVVAAEDSQQTQNLNVEPHQGHYQAEGAGPGVAARSASVHQRLSVLEVKHQGHSCHNHGNGANDQAQWDARNGHGVQAKTRRPPGR